MAKATMLASETHANGDEPAISHVEVFKKYVFLLLLKVILQVNYRKPTYEHRSYQYANKYN